MLIFLKKRKRKRCIQFQSQLLFGLSCHMNSDILSEDMKIALDLMDWIFWTSDLMCLLFNICEIKLRSHSQLYPDMLFSNTGMFEWFKLCLNIFLLILFNFMYYMLKMLKEVLKMDRLTGGSVVESLGVCQSGKQ